MAPKERRKGMCRPCKWQVVHETVGDLSIRSRASNNPSYEYSSPRRMCRNWRPLSVAVEKIATKNLGADQRKPLLRMSLWLFGSGCCPKNNSQKLRIQWSVCKGGGKLEPYASIYSRILHLPNLLSEAAQSQAACRTQPARIPAGQWLEIYGLQWSQGVDANIVRNPFFTGLVQGKSYKKPPPLIGQLLVFCRFSLKSSQWFLPGRSKEQSSKKKTLNDSARWF